MSSLKFNSAVLFVKDIEISKAFYTELLEFGIESDFGSNVTLRGGLSLWQISDWHVIEKQGLTKDKKGHDKELYFETTNIIEPFEKLKGASVEFFHEIIDEPWGQKVFRFFDPDNHLIEIGESLETFVPRMYSEGLAINAIVEQTGIPKQFVEELLERG